MNIDDKIVHEGLQRFAATPDGRAFYVGLQKVVTGMPTDSEAGALRENLGRRRFAAELMAVMAEGMSETNASDDPRTRPIIYTVPQPVALGAGTRGARRRVSAGSPDSE